jgi:hypothetical protein
MWTDNLEMIRCLSKEYPDELRLTSWRSVWEMHRWTVAPLNLEPVNIMSDGWRSLELGSAGFGT